MDKHGFIILLSMISSMSFTDPADPSDAEFSSSACFEQPDKTLLANCSLGQMVKINDIFFGHSSDGHCSRADDNQCIIRDPEIPSCVGHSACSVNLPTGDLGRKIQHCNQFTNYIQMLYNCIPSDEVIDICRHQEITTQKGYIKSSHYPNNYPATHQCNLTIQAHPSQQIRLYAIDLDLGSIAGGDCIDLLYIQEQYKSATVCGKRNNDLIFTTVGSAVTLTFQSNKEGLNKGFWLKFEAFPHIATSTAPPTVTDSTATPLASPGNYPAASDQETHHPPPDLRGRDGSSKAMKGQGANVPLEGIVGAILGVLFFVLLVLLIFLIIKRRKDRESMSTSHSTAQLHTGSGSGVSTSRSFQGKAGPYIQNNLVGIETETPEGATGGCDTKYEDEQYKSANPDEICNSV